MSSIKVLGFFHKIFAFEKANQVKNMYVVIFIFFRKEYSLALTNNLYAYIIYIYKSKSTAFHDSFLSKLDVYLS